MKRYSLSILLVVFISGLLVTPKLGDVVAFLFLLFGVVALLLHKQVRAVSELELKAIVIPFMFFSLLSLCVYLIWPESDGSRMKLERYLLFILSLFMYFGFKSIQLSINQVSLVFSLSLATISLVSILQYFSMYFFGSYILTFDYWVAEYWLRPSGAVHPMRFSAVAWILVSFILVWVYESRFRISKWVYFALGAGVLAIVMAKTRGTWVAIFIIVSFLMVRGLWIKQISGYKVFGFLALLLIVGGMTPPIKDRLSLAVSDIERYALGDRQSSIGARFDMFDAAFQIIKEAPLTGHGLDSYQGKALDIKSVTPGMSGEVGRWRNPHNEFLQVWVEKGVMGVFSYVLILGGPLTYFILMRRREDLRSKYIAACGLLLIVSYFIIGQSVALFEHRVFSLFYCTMLMFFVGQLSSVNQKEVKGLGV